MLKLLWKYVVSFFTADRIGVLIRSLFAQIGKQLAKQILDPSNQQKAYEFAKAVAQDKTLTNEQKTKLFNDKMREYAKSAGKNITECAINCLRELAVTAVKNETMEN